MEAIRKGSSDVRKIRNVQVKNVNVPKKRQSTLDILHMRLRKAFRSIHNDLENFKNRTQKDFSGLKQVMKNEILSLKKDIQGKSSQDHKKLLLYFDNYKQIVDKDLSALKLKEKEVLEALKVSSNLATLEKQVNKIENSSNNFVKEDIYSKTIKDFRGELDKKTLSKAEFLGLEKEMSTLKRDFSKLGKLNSNVQDLKNDFAKLRATTLTRYNFNKQAKWIKEIESDVLELISIKTQFDQLATVKEVREMRSDFDEALVSNSKISKDFNEILKKFDKNSQDFAKLRNDLINSNELLEKEFSNHKTSSEKLFSKTVKDLKKDVTDYKTSSDKLFSKGTKDTKNELSNLKKSLLSEIDDINKRQTSMSKDVSSQLSILDKDVDLGYKDIEGLQNEFEEMKTNLLLMHKTVSVQQKNIDILNRREGLKGTNKLPKLKVKKKALKKKQSKKSSKKKNIAKRLYDWLMEDEDQD